MIISYYKKYTTIRTKIEDLKNIELGVLPVYYDKYIKKIYKNVFHKVYTNFCDLSDARKRRVLEDGVECEFFTIISIDCLLVYENKY